MESKNLWAPWRINYIQALDTKPGCFICHSLKMPEDDESNFLLWRRSCCAVIMNKYPYNNGHLLVVPKRHIDDLDKASQEEMLEMMNVVRDCKTVLSAAIKPDGFNIGINLGRCAGAGLPGHIHIHIVPRWSGDTNFINVCSDTDVISQSMIELYSLLIKTADELKLFCENDSSKDDGR